MPQIELSDSTLDSVLALAESSVNIAVRPWVAGADYLALQFDLNERVKSGFDAAGIVIPFPPRGLHLDGAVVGAAS